MPNEQAPLTTGEFHEAINTLMEVVATKEDLKRFATKDDLEGVATKEDLSRVEAKIDRLTDGTDEYLKKTETWHQEQTVLRASNERVKKVLVKKGVASEQELAA